MTLSVSHINKGNTSRPCHNVCLYFFFTGLTLVGTFATCSGDASETKQMPAASGSSQATVLNTAPGDVAADLAKDLKLQGKVSFEARRRSLPQVLAELQKQSRVQLTALPGPIVNRSRVTAHVTDMPLAEMMATLSRLYGLQWVKQADDRYEMRERLRNSSEADLLRLGDLEWLALENWHDAKLRRQQSMALAQAVKDEAGEASLRSDEGVMVSELTPELQQRLRLHLEAPAARGLVTAYSKADEGTITSYSLRFESRPIVSKRNRPVEHTTGTEPKPPLFAAQIQVFDSTMKPVLTFPFANDEPGNVHHSKD